MKCMSMRLKVFQKHLNSTQISQKQVLQPICLQNSNIKDILHQNPGTCNLEWPQQDHTQYNVISLAKRTLQCVQLAKALKTCEVICKQKSITISTKFITQNLKETITKRVTSYNSHISQKTSLQSCKFLDLPHIVHTNFNIYLIQL